MSQISYKGHVFKESVSLTPLEELLIDEPIKGEEFGSNKYVDYRYKKAVRYLKISDIDENKFTVTTSRDSELVLTKKIKSIVKNKDIVIQTASKNLGKLSMYLGKDTPYNSHLRILDIQERYKYYVLAFFNTTIGQSLFNQIGSIQGVDNFKKEHLNQALVPIITDDEFKNVTTYSKQIVELEMKIKQIRQEMNDIFNNELGLNGDELLLTQRNTSYANISELTNNAWNFREYTSDFRKVKAKIIELSKNKPFYFDEEKLRGGSTPKKRILASDNRFKTTWITPTFFDDFGYIDETNSIASPKLKTVKHPSLLIVNRTSRGNGEYVGIAGYCDGTKPFTNNQGVYRFSDASSERLIYLTALINSDIYRYLFQSIGKGSKMREIKINDLITIPMYIADDNIENKIVKLMHNYLDSSKKQQQLRNEIQDIFNKTIF